MLREEIRISANWLMEKYDVVRGQKRQTIPVDAR
jgi:hypothetical protein